jgi:two-component system, chemotaxis family, chemotaxis protein CheY
MKHALVIDDSSAIRLVARRILERLEFEVVEAPDTDAGYEACRHQPPDFIFLDLHIPGGVEFLGYQRSRVGGPQAKVLLCTVESDDPNLDSAFRAGADDYMLKPFDRQVLETRLREIGVLEPLAETSAMAPASG